MNFTVKWSPEAEDAITTIWLNSDSERRREVTTAIHQIDDLLRKSPHSVGESRDEDRRVLFALPLAVELTVIDSLHEVQVTRVRFVKKK